ILAEAAHSSLDLAAAIITFFAVRISDKPADDTHPYGHGKVESVGALAETALLLLTCVWIVSEAINRLFFENKSVDPNAWAFVVMLVSIAIDISRSRALDRVARKYHSQALEADALHFSTDIWSSIVVIIGLGLVKIGDVIGAPAAFVRADAVAALLVALIVIVVSVRLGARSIDALLDRAPRGLAEQIDAATKEIENVRAVKSTRVRAVGSQVFADLQIDVPRHFSFEESHAVETRVEDAIKLIAPDADVVVHANPSAAKEGVLEKIHAVAARGHFAVHNITTHLTRRGMWIDLDLEVDPEMTFERAHALSHNLETELRAELDREAHVADINIHIEPREQALLPAIEIKADAAARYVDRIQTIGAEISHARGCQDIALQNLGDEIYLSFHLRIDVNQTISQVHAIAEEMERRLREEFPELGRVVIHTEPDVEQSR
ncbi:MAG: cation diffusion facilitator family transporter, partial [Chloroflexi bacterium]|nr:cation diffusion facilitator family transporter [Chloroflexota bacterium]